MILDDLNKIKDIFGFNHYNILDYNFILPQDEEATRITNQNIMTEIAKRINKNASKH